MLSFRLVHDNVRFWMLYNMVGLYVGRSQRSYKSHPVLFKARDSRMMLLAFYAFIRSTRSGTNHSLGSGHSPSVTIVSTPVLAGPVVFYHVVNIKPWKSLGMYRLLYLEDLMRRAILVIVIMIIMILEDRLRHNREPIADR